MQKLDFSQYKVLVIGDVMLDKYLNGKVTRISPEAPVPILNVEERTYRLGGAANVALNLVSLGAQSGLIGMIGDDEEAQLLSNALTSKSITNGLFVSANARPTTVKTRLVARHQQLLRVDREDSSPYSDEDKQGLKHKVEEVLASAKYDYVILQDYNKGLFTEDTITWIIDKCRALDLPYAVDPKYQFAENFKNADIYKPNYKEASSLATKIAGREITDIDEMAALIMKELSSETLFITRSSAGIFYQSNESKGNEPTQEREILDVCGAGDAVISTLVLARLAGLELAHMARIANIAGGQVCEKPTVVPVDINSLRKEWSSLYTDI